MKNGFVHHFLLFSFFFIFLFILALGARKYIYQGYQHIGKLVGFNFNNIATQSYVDWIKFQTTDLEADQKAIYLNKLVKFNDVESQAAILGTSTSSNPSKVIEIDLSEQRLYLKEDGKDISSFLVSTGKWAPTPTGDFAIWTKLRYTRMTGGSQALGTYYNLPNVPYTMYYYKGYGIHGAYWHNNFGNPMSHGCVNMRPEEAGIVFNWAEVGTKVIVRT